MNSEFGTLMDLIKSIEPEEFELNGRKLRSLEDLIRAIKMGLDIQIDLLGIRYYIGAPQDVLLISWDEGVNEVTFENEDEDKAIAELLQYNFNEFRIKDVWKEIEVYAM